MSDPDDRWSVSLAGKTLLERFAVQHKLGGGGMASVYLATDEQLEVPVVVKVPHPAYLAEDGFRERFGRETRDLVTLQHPHIVRIVARGEHEGLPFLVMPFLDGGSFGDRMRKQKGTPMPFDEIRPWIRDVARALDFIHGQGVVHRDVKPDNVLFDEHGNAYLSDFGIAKAVGGADTGLTLTGATPGSPAYMAPETPRTNALTGASDQYSLAATLYEALAGRPTFEGETVVDVLLKKQSELPDPLAEVEPSVPRPVADALMRSLARAPDDRHETCEALVDAMLTPAPEAAQGALAAAAPAATTVMAAAPTPDPAPTPVPTPVPGPVHEPGAQTTSVGTTLTLGGSTKAMWVVFAVVLLGGPLAAFMLTGNGDEGRAQPTTEVGDAGTDPSAGPRVPSMRAAPESTAWMRAGPAKSIEKASLVVGTWVVDREVIRKRLREADAGPRTPRVAKRHRRELQQALDGGHELVLHADGKFRMKLRALDRRPLELLEGTWALVDGAVHLTPDRSRLPTGKKRPAELLQATLHARGLVLRRPGGALGVPLVRQR